MTLKTNEIIKQITFVLHEYYKRSDDICPPFVDRTACLEIYPMLCDILDRFCPPDSNYEYSVSSITENCELHDATSVSKTIQSLVPILVSLKTAYENNLLDELSEIYHADIFNDFLEMSEYLLSEGYKDPAAMMIGGVLEEHLRKLCQKYNISVNKEDNSPKKAAALNDELMKADILKKGEHKTVVAWLDIRNSAAHAKYTEYQPEQVKLMLLGVRDFISRYPA
ncbi:MAG: hypothetical protein NTV10_03745 [Methanoregula sp.]|nr:hypothetical protein [Methanoregula sp.]